MAVITISRQYGSGGEEIACAVCEKLGYRYFDKRLLDQMVSQESLTAQQSVDYHEDTYKMRSFLDKVRGYRPCPVPAQPAAAGAAFPRAAEAEEQIGENMLVWVADAAIRSAHEAGNVVIVGRGGQAILHDKPGVLHVRVEAPLDVRVQRVAERDNLALPVARQAVTKHDKAAADYLKRFYGVTWTDPLLYHLLLNTGRLSLDAAGDLLIEAVHYMERGEAAPKPEPA